MINLFFISIFFIFGSLIYFFPASLGHSSHRSKQHRRRYKNIYSLKKIAFFNEKNRNSGTKSSRSYGQIQYTYIYIVIYIEEPTTSLCVCLYLWEYIYIQTI